MLVCEFLDILMQLFLTKLLCTHWFFFVATARVLFAKVCMGAQLPTNKMEEDGKMSYTFKRPIGGAYIDILYLDETVRITRSNTGVIYVCAKVPYFPDE